MIRKILLENFMAHARTELVLGPGMTVLSGPNNTGKSAVVEALRCVAENPAPRHVIRHGAKSARVELVLDDGVSVAWVRRKKSAVYEVRRPGEAEVQVFAKLRQGGVPEEVRDLLRLDPVVLERGDAVDVHIGSQRKPVFLLDDSAADAKLAEFFAASSESAHLLAMQRKLKNRVADAKRELSDREERMALEGATLDALSGLPALALGMERAGELEAACRALAAELPALEELLTRRERLEADLTALARRRETLAALRPAQERLWPVAALDARLVALDEATAALARAGRTKRTLEPLASAPEVFDTTALRRREREIAQLHGLLSKRSAVADSLQNLAGPPEAEPTRALAAAVAGLAALDARLCLLAGRARKIGALVEPPALHDAQPLKGLLADMERLETALTRESRTLEAREAALKAHELRLAEALERAGDCPLCGAGMELSRFVGRAGDGVVPSAAPVGTAASRPGDEKTLRSGKGVTPGTGDESEGVEAHVGGRS